MASVEVMTACENVCRDFSWLWAIDARVWQGLLTIVAAVIASGTALHIAVRVYPRQKKVDQILQIELEQRTVYKEIVASVNALTESISKISTTNPEDARSTIEFCLSQKRELEIMLVQTSILSDANIVKCVAECIEQVDGMLKKIATELQRTVSDSDAFQRVMEGAKRDAIRELDEILTKLLNTIRKEAFGLSGDIFLRSRYLDGE